MADEITNKVLLEHIQGMKYEIQQEMKGMKQDMKDVKKEIQQEIRDVKKDVVRLEQKMDKGFEEAREHRQALQEDLVATMEDTVRIRRHVGMPVVSE
ncbi:hypothetical protein A2635_03225 [Candidatus Peribacteria bacterium RIFCSPHIGHO2_01_FULL_51_9]|nr:MAG: hypothetical protein A2635_03225 [Candidatus Peribacteria bacterium RIFCSPHIGHO2_01_FULL_51_9]